jgi:hypothetical protein
MYYYSLGYSGYEESDEVILLHNLKFTKKEFFTMIENAIVEIIKTKKQSNEYCHSYENIHEDVKCFLVEKNGFKFLQCTEYWIINGFSSIFGTDPDSGVLNTTKTAILENDDQMDELTRVRDRINSEGYDTRDDDLYKNRFMAQGGKRLLHEKEL